LLQQRQKIANQLLHSQFVLKAVTIENGYRFFLNI